MSEAKRPNGELALLAQPHLFFQKRIAVACAVRAHHRISRDCGSGSAPGLKRLPAARTARDLMQQLERASAARDPPSAQIRIDDPGKRQLRKMITLATMRR
jgi:hypothetical protein